MTDLAFFEVNPLPRIKVKNSIQIFSKTNVLVATILKHLQTIPEFENLRGDLELLEYVCQMVEMSIRKGNSKRVLKIDKKQIVMNVFQQLFVLNTLETKNLESQIDYLISNKIIKCASFSLKKSVLFVGKWLFQNAK